MISVGKKRIKKELRVRDEVYNAAAAKFPVLWPEYYLGLVKGDLETHAVARMGRPTVQEIQACDGDLNDPVADQSSRVGRFIVQKHPDRVVVLCTRRCHFYCRFCFRRDENVSGISELRQEDWEEIFSYLHDHPQITEIILSGGDPLTLSDTKLNWILRQCGRVPSLVKVRIHTRAPVHFPQRVTKNLMENLACTLPLTVVTHFNHFVELTPQSYEGIMRFKDAGIEMKNQSVLLSGVNDCPVVLFFLCSRLIEWGIQPYYLHHPDRAMGNQAFRLSIHRGLSVYSGLKNIIAVHGGETGACLPAYVLDLPDGKGKVPVSTLVAVSPGQYQTKHTDGSTSIYKDIALSSGESKWAV